MLGARKSSQTDELSTRGRQENLDVYYIIHSYFDLPRRSIRKNSDRRILFKQTLRDVESMFKDVAGYDKKRDEFKEMCRKAWRDEYNYLCSAKTEKKLEVKFLIPVKAKAHVINVFVKVKLFSFLIVIPN